MYSAGLTPRSDDPIQRFATVAMELARRIIVKAPTQAVLLTDSYQGILELSIIGNAKDADV